MQIRIDVQFTSYSAPATVTLKPKLEATSAFNVTNDRADLANYIVIQRSEITVPLGQAVPTIVVVRGDIRTKEGAIPDARLGVYVTGNVDISGKQSLRPSNFRSVRDGIYNLLVGPMDVFYDPNKGKVYRDPSKQ